MLEGEVVGEAREVLAVGAFTARIALWEIDQFRDDQATGQPKCRFDRVGEAPLGGRLGHQAIDHHLDGVLLLLLQRRRLLERENHTVDAHPCIALRLQLPEQVGVFTFALSDDGAQNLEPCAFRHLKESIDDLTRRLLGDGLTAHGAVRLADSSEEQTQVVVDLGDGADRGSRVP